MNFRFKNNLIKAGEVESINVYNSYSQVKEIVFDQPIGIKALARMMKSGRRWQKKLLNGDDVITGETGNDYIWGGDGNDKIVGGRGSGTLIGGRGDDVIFGGPSGAEYFQAAWGGPGKDTYILDSKGHIMIEDFDIKHDTLNFAGIKGLYLDYDSENGHTYIVDKNDEAAVARLNGVSDINEVNVVY